MHSDDCHLTAVSTPFRLYEWLVMLMGLKNAPSIHQWQVTSALHKYIGKICHIYLDDIIIWSNDINKHHRNVQLVLQALKDTQLYCNLKKTKLFCREINFLGYHISQAGIVADNSKVEHILDWPIPKSTMEVCGFLGLVRYIAVFLPNLTDHMVVLTELTHKDCDKNFPAWEE